MRSLLIAIMFVCNSLFQAQSNNEFPIIALPGIPEGEMSTLSNYLKMKEAGFNVNHVQFTSTQNMLKALDVAEKAGVKLLVYSWDLQQKPEEVVPFIKNHKALFGYFIYDEVRPEMFSFVKDVYERVKKIDDKHVIYANAYPNYVPEEHLKGMIYKEYLDAYLRSIPFKIFSFDNYPIVNNTIRTDFYSNLEDVKEVADKHNVPIWAFACTAIHFSYLKPTLAGIRLQQYSNLLYGAKALQYYTYWSYSDSHEWKRDKYEYAVVDKFGKPTPTYDIVKKVNSDIQKLAWIFTTTKVDDVYHMGGSIPVGTKRLNFLPSKFKVFKSFDNKVLVSFMRNKEREFVIVQNKNLTKEVAFNFHVNKGVSLVSNSTGKIIKAPTNNAIKKISPGDILIFTYR